jgi:hypothetical protein
MAAQSIVPGSFQDAFAITPSDTLGISVDAANTKGYKHCYVHNPAAGGTVRVLPADSDVAVTIYIPQGATSELAVKQVFLTTPTPPTGIIAYIAKSYG